MPDKYGHASGLQTDRKKSHLRIGVAGMRGYTSLEWHTRMLSAHGATHAKSRSGPCPRKDSPMPGHDVIVIGGTAGSLEPLTTLVAGLPPDLPAAVCVTR